MCSRHENLQVFYSVLEHSRSTMGAETTKDLLQMVLERANARTPRVYLCGGPTFVHGTKKKLYLGGTSLDRIHADPFVEAPPSLLH